MFIVFSERDNLLGVEIERRRQLERIERELHEEIQNEERQRQLLENEKNEVKNAFLILY